MDVPHSTLPACSVCIFLCVQHFRLCGSKPHIWAVVRTRVPRKTRQQTGRGTQLGLCVVLEVKKKTTYPLTYWQNVKRAENLCVCCLALLYRKLCRRWSHTHVSLCFKALNSSPLNAETSWIEVPILPSSELPAIDRLHLHDIGPPPFQSHLCSAQLPHSVAVSATNYLCIEQRILSPWVCSDSSAEQFQQMG